MLSEYCFLHFCLLILKFTIYLLLFYMFISGEYLFCSADIENIPSYFVLLIEKDLADCFFFSYYLFCSAVVFYCLYGKPRKLFVLFC